MSGEKMNMEPCVVLVMHCTQSALAAVSVARAHPASFGLSRSMHALPCLAPEGHLLLLHHLLHRCGAHQAPALHHALHLLHHVGCRQGKGWGLFRETREVPWPALHACSQGKPFMLRMRFSTCRQHRGFFHAIASRVPARIQVRPRPPTSPHTLPVLAPSLLPSFRAALHGPVRATSSSSQALSVSGPAHACCDRAP